MIALLKICAIGIAALMLIGVVRTYKPELTVATAFCAGLILLYILLDSLRYGLEYVASVYDGLTYGREYFPIIIKVLGIAYVTEFAVALCKDAGENSIAGKIELAGKAAIFFAAIPVFTSLLELLGELI